MHTVVVGGGFAGIKAALELSKHELGRVTLLSDRDYFLHHGSIYAVATGCPPDAAMVALDDIFAPHPNVKVINTRMTSIDPDRKLVVCGDHSYDYDKLVLALGSELDETQKSTHRHIFGVCGREQITAIHEHLQNSIINDHYVDRQYVIVGGGATGVELAGALAYYVRQLVEQHLAEKIKVRITLAESSERLLPRASHEASKYVTKRLQTLGVHVATNTRVTPHDDEFVTVDGRKIPTETVIWTTGTKAHSFYKSHPHYFDTTSKGSVIVNPYLEAYRNIYVLGDNVEGYGSNTIRSALDMGEYIADHLWRQETGKLYTPYRPSSASFAVSVGDDWSYVEALSVYTTGRLADWMRRRIVAASYRKIMSKSMVDAAMQAHKIKNPPE